MRDSLSYAVLDAHYPKLNVHDHKSMSQCLGQQPWARMTHMLVSVACAVARCSFREFPHKGPCALVVRNNADDQGQPIHAIWVARSAERLV